MTASSGDCFPLLDCSLGASVVHQGRLWKVVQIDAFDSVILQSVDGEERSQARVEEVYSPLQSFGAVPADLRDDEVALALARFEHLSPFIYKHCIASDLVTLEAATGLKRAAIYQLIRRLRQVPHPLALVRRRRGVKRGSQLLPSSTEKIIRQQIDSASAGGLAIKVDTIKREIEVDCVDAGLRPPCKETIRNRIELRNADLMLRKKLGTRRAAERVRAMPGTIISEAPLADVEIDHSPLDMFLVSSVDRKCIGRAYLTVVSDMYTRSVLGFHLGLDAPSALTVALALLHAVMPKETWLSERGLGNLEWPMYGVMRGLQVDHASEFRSAKFAQACERWGIALRLRTKKEDGGIIERLIGTLQSEASQEPGASGNDPRRQRGARPAASCAHMTLQEAERWLAREISGKYHLERHSGIGMPPIQKWKAWHLMPGKAALPPMLKDAGSFFISFLPFEMRIISPSGISLFSENYFCDELIFHVRPALRYRVHYDPRLLGRVYVALNDRYIEVPYANPSQQRLPKFELEHQRRELRAAHPDQFDLQRRVQHTKEKRADRAASQNATRAARRQERLLQSAKLHMAVSESNPELDDSSTPAAIDYSATPQVGDRGPV